MKTKSLQKKEKMNKHNISTDNGRTSRIIHIYKNKNTQNRLIRNALHFSAHQLFNIVTILGNHE